PGVVAMGATDKGVLYEGAFGARALDASTPMTLDTVFRIASMTKAITSVAAMQLVEQGKLKLDEPVPNIDPALGSPQVLEGFDAGGAPKLRPAKRPITLRHLLTHTAGFSYDLWDPNTGRYIKAVGLRPALLDRARLPDLLADAAARRHRQRRPDAEAGDRRRDEPQQYRRHSVRCPEDREPGPLERRRPLPRRPAPLGARLHAER